MRSHIEIDAPAETAWGIVRRAEALPSWFASIASATVEADVRVVELVGGGIVREHLVNVDDELRRLQYRIVDGIAVSDHLATIDVIETNPHRCLVVYSTEVHPDRIGVQLGGAVRGALAALKTAAESGRGVS
jgi:hypothetical protein